MCISPLMKIVPNSPNKCCFYSCVSNVCLCPPVWYHTDDIGLCRDVRKSCYFQGICWQYEKYRMKPLLMKPSCLSLGEEAPTPTAPTTVVSHSVQSFNCRKDPQGQGQRVKVKNRNCFVLWTRILHFSRQRDTVSSTFVALSPSPADKPHSRLSD